MFAHSWCEHKYRILSHAWQIYQLLQFLCDLEYRKWKREKKNINFTLSNYSLNNKDTKIVMPG